MEGIILIIMLYTLVGGAIFSVAIDIDNPYGDYPFDFKGFVFIHEILKEKFNLMGRIIIYILLLPVLMFYLFGCLVINIIFFIVRVFCFYFMKEGNDEYFKNKENYDWVLVKYYDKCNFECVPSVAEWRFDKWYLKDNEKPLQDFEVKYFFDMQQLDKLKAMKEGK